MALKGRIARTIGAFALETAKDVILLGATTPLRRLSPFRSSYKLELRGLGTFKLRRGTTDLDVVRKIFAAREYDLSRFAQWPRIRSAYDEIRGRGRRPLVIDAGANNGASPLWFAAQFPEALVVAIEPDPANVRLCRENTAARPNIEVHEAAIGGKGGSVGLTNPEGTAWAVQTVRDADGARVPVTTVQEILSAHPGCDLFLVKADIEGFEEDLFSENLEWLSLVTVLIVEPHDWMLPGRFSSVTLQHAVAGHRFELLISRENLIYIR